MALALIVGRRFYHDSRRHFAGCRRTLLGRSIISAWANRRRPHHRNTWSRS